MARHLQCGDQAQVLIIAGQLHEALTHAATGPIDADGDSHDHTSIARMISSRLLGTCTARFAKVARRTPRAPRTSSKVFWSVLWYATVAVGSFNWCPVRMHTTRSPAPMTPSCRSLRVPATLAADAG